MKRLLSPRTLTAVTGVMGLTTAICGVIGAMQVALVAVGLALTTIALLIWSVQARLSPRPRPIGSSATGSATTSKEVQAAIARIEEAERRIVISVETLRRDIYERDTRGSSL